MNIMDQWQMIMYRERSSICSLSKFNFVGLIAWKCID